LGGETSHKRRKVETSTPVVAEASTAVAADDLLAGMVNL
jgi:hypothetical protein